MNLILSPTHFCFRLRKMLLTRILFILLALELAKRTLSERDLLTPYSTTNPQHSGSGLDRSGSGSGSGSETITTTASETQGITLQSPNEVSVYISLTFVNLTREHFRDQNIQRTLSELIVRLLNLSATPAIVLDLARSHSSTTVIQVHFDEAEGSLALLQRYSSLLASSDDVQWLAFKQAYVSQSLLLHYNNYH